MNEKELKQLEKDVAEADDLMRCISCALCHFQKKYDESEVYNIATTTKSMLKLVWNNIESMRNLWERDLPAEPLPELTEEERKELPF